MSLVPMLFSDYWDDLEHPHIVHDQHFGLSLNPEDFARKTSSLRYAEQLYPALRRIRRRYHPFHHASFLAKRPSGKLSSFFQTERDRFCANIDVQHFSQDEINVKIVDKSVVVEARHEEREDEHGWISRQFVRKYPVAGHFDIDQVETKLSSDGVLTITIPRKKPFNSANNERPIKILYTGEPVTFEDTQGPTSRSNQAREGDSSLDYPQRSAQMGQRGKKLSVKGT